MQTKRSSRSVALGICAGALLALSVTTPVRAQSVASTYVGGGTFYVPGTVDGWQFTLNTNISVTALGIEDFTPTTGFADAHNIALDDYTTNTTLTEVTMDTGTIDPLVDGARYMYLATPITLLTGHQYGVIASNFVTDQVVYGNTAVSYAPEINWTGYANQAQGFVPAGSPGAQFGDLGPTFQFVLAPEPGIVALMSAFAFTSAGLLKSRRRSK